MCFWQIESKHFWENWSLTHIHTYANTRFSYSNSTNIKFLFAFSRQRTLGADPSWTPPTFWPSDWLYFMTIARKHAFGCSPVTSCKGCFYVLNGRLGCQVYVGDPGSMVWYGGGLKGCLRPGLQFPVGWDMEIPNHLPRPPVFMVTTYYKQPGAC